MSSETIVIAKRGGLKEFVESRLFTAFVTAVIVVNAITLGLETSPTVVAVAGPLLHFADTAALWIFTIELALKLRVYRGRFFKDGWNVFDLTIVTIAWIPAAGPLSVLRALRIMRRFLPPRSLVRGGMDLAPRKHGSQPGNSRFGHLRALDVQFTQLCHSCEPRDRCVSHRGVIQPERS